MEDVPYAISSKLVTDVPLSISEHTKQIKERYTSLSKYLVDSLMKRVQNTHESVA